MRQIPKARFWDKLMLMMGRGSAFLIDGDSMLPTLKEGDRVIIDRKAAISPGDVVVAAHPYKKSVRLVKRVESVSGDRCILFGDNPTASSDSRVFGSISRDDVLGKVVRRF